MSNNYRMQQLELVLICEDPMMSMTQNPPWPGSTRQALQPSIRLRYVIRTHTHVRKAS